MSSLGTRVLGPALCAVGALALLGGVAHAATATNLGNSSIGIYLKGNPNGSQLPAISDTESTVFLEGSNAGANLGFGNIGSNTNCSAGNPCVNFYSPTLLDFSNGNATITAHTSNTAYHELDVTVPGFTFGDILFGVQLTSNTNQDLEIQVFTGGNSPAIDVVVPTADLASGLMSFLISTPATSDGDSTDSLITKIVLLSTYGIQSVEGLDETKQWSISNVEAVAATPIPAALWLFGSVFGGAAGLTKWRNRRKPAGA